MRWILAAVILGLCFAAAPAQADDDAEMASWRQRLDQAETELVRSRKRAAKADAAYVNMRHDRSVRGPEKAKVLAERAESEHALANAQASLDALREQARRAGVPPAWVLPDPPAEPSSDF